MRFLGGGPLYLIDLPLIDIGNSEFSMWSSDCSQALQVYCALVLCVDKGSWKW